MPFMTPVFSNQSWRSLHPQAVVLVTCLAKELARGKRSLSIVVFAAAFPTSRSLAFNHVGTNGFKHGISDQI